MINNRALSTSTSTGNKSRLARKVFGNNLPPSSSGRYATLIPHFKRKHSMVPVRTLLSTVAKHDWNRNQSLQILRRHLGMRSGIDARRRATLRCLCMAMVYHCSFSHGDEYAMEVIFSVRDLAKEIGKLIQYYRDDCMETVIREDYGTVLEALNMLEAAGLVIVVREVYTCPDSKEARYKASRVFLTDKFFYELGFNQQALKGLINEVNELRKKNCGATGLTSYDQRYMGQDTKDAAHARYNKKNVASIKSFVTRSKLFYSTQRIRKAFSSNDPSPGKATPGRNAMAPLTPYQEVAREINSLINTVPSVYRIQLKADIKLREPEPEAQQCLYFQLIQKYMSDSNAERLQQLLDKLEHTSNDPPH